MKNKIWEENQGKLLNNRMKISISDQIYKALRGGIKCPDDLAVKFGEIKKKKRD